MGCLPIRCDICEHGPEVLRLMAVETDTENLAGRLEIRSQIQAGFFNEFTAACLGPQIKAIVSRHCLAREYAAASRRWAKAHPLINYIVKTAIECCLYGVVLPLQILIGAGRRVIERRAAASADVFPSKANKVDDLSPEYRW